MKSASAVLSSAGTRRAASAGKGISAPTTAEAQKIDKASQRFVVIPIPGFY
jgi:hypothetical protein